MTTTLSWVDGVPVYWTTSGRPTLRASLIFRSGWADETLPTAGTTHLLEHVTLHGGHEANVEFNGSVSGLLTTFDVAGTPEDVASFLRVARERLAALPAADVEHERRVLQAEGATRLPSALGRALTLRYGARGPGMLAWNDLAVEQIAPAAVQALSDAWFTAANAALALDGPIPAGLRLPLPPGVRRPTVDAVPRFAAYPVGHEGFSDVVVLSGVAADTAATDLGISVWRRRVRRDLGDVIGPRAAITELGQSVGASVLAGLLVSTDAKRSADVLATLRRTLADLAAQGPTPAELADQQRGFRLAHGLRDAADAGPWRQARAALLGQPALPLDEHAAEYDAVTVGRVASALAAIQASAMVQVPPGTDRAAASDITWTPTADPPADPLGRGYRLIGVGGWRRDAATLVLGERTLQHRSKNDTFTLLLPDLSAAICYGDGGLVLVTPASETLRLEPRMWKPADLVQQVLARIPEGVRLARPARDEDALPKPESIRDAYVAAVLKLTRRPDGQPT